MRRIIVLAALIAAAAAPAAGAATPGRTAYVNGGTIFTMRVDGGDVVRLVHVAGDTSGPTYSPDGRTIAFATDLGDYPAKQGIYVVRASDGTHLRRVTRLSQTGAYDLAPQFAPGGKQIVFTRTRTENGHAVSALIVTNLKGTDVRRITTWKSL
jgi:Tol biopolymer transport system component